MAAGPHSPPCAGGHSGSDFGELDGTSLAQVRSARRRAAMDLAKATIREQMARIKELEAQLAAMRRTDAGGRKVWLSVPSRVATRAAAIVEGLDEHRQDCVGLGADIHLAHRARALAAATSGEKVLRASGSQLWANTAKHAALYSIADQDFCKLTYKQLRKLQRQGRRGKTCCNSQAGAGGAYAAAGNEGTDGHGCSGGDEKSGGELGNGVGYCSVYGWAGMRR